MRRALTIVALSVALAASPARAVQPDEILPDAGQESRARALSAHLRCLVCQNQSIDDSNAPLARDLRLFVRERIRAGDNDKAVMDYIVARYGEFVLLNPRLRGETLILWLTPLLALAAGILLARSAAGRRERQESTLSAEEQAKLDALLQKDS